MEQNTNIDLKAQWEIEKERLGLKAKLQQKKNKVRKELASKGALKKGAKTDFDKYQYFSEAQHKQLFEKLFADNGIEFSANEVDYAGFQGTQAQPFGRFVSVEFILTDIETGYSESSIHTGEGIDRGDKAIYKATTGALKRFLANTFMVATKDDPELEDTKPQKPKMTDNSWQSPATASQKKYIRTLYQNRIDELREELKQMGLSDMNSITKGQASTLIEKNKKE